ncbi:MAG: peptidase M15 [Rickettsiales bacterium]|nr:MAG: peptidase M15 [Rickettsiales bacterium]
MNNTLPDGFVYLSTIDDTIKSNLRYATDNNFLGRIVDGYHSTNQVILTEKAAINLSSAQKIFNKSGWQILIYDAYRPKKAVEDFIIWAEDPHDHKMKDYYYPTIDKKDSFDLGYISKRSGHTRGSTVDITLLSIDQNFKSIKNYKRILNDKSEIIFLDDNTIDMGSSFDLFSNASHYQNDLISEKHTENRYYMRDIMEANGWMSYSKEWWHFSLVDEPFSDTYFDFDVK